MNTHHSDIQPSTISAYFRANFPYWAKRWALAMIGAAALSLGMGIKGREYILPALGAVAIVLAFTMVAVALALVVAGFLHVRGYRPKPWMTKERGLGASLLAFVVILLIYGGLVTLYGM